MKISPSISKHKERTSLRIAKNIVYYMVKTIEGIMLILEAIGHLTGSLFHCRHHIIDQWGKEYPFPYILERFLSWQEEFIRPIRTWSQH